MTLDVRPPITILGVSVTRPWWMTSSQVSEEPEAELEYESDGVTDDEFDQDDFFEHFPRP
ncbi:hypothetical protein [Actinoplanes sp. G11-F43]|uniref:hypothetical protein n=1 Tax=Actinoplanes sp. G11-F43 TaxID=3424130 RepID=UPI003D3298BF